MVIICRGGTPDHGFSKFGEGFNVFFHFGRSPDGVGSGLGAGLQAVKPLLQRVLHFGAGDDHQVFVTARVDGCLIF